MWGRVMQTDLVTWPFKLGSYNLHMLCKIDKGIVLANFAALRVAVFFVIDEKPPGADIRPPSLRGLSHSVLGWGWGWTPPFSQISQTRRLRWLKVSSPGHFKWPHLIKSLNARLSSPNDLSHWNFQRLVSVPVSMKCIFYIGDLRSSQFYDLSIISQWEKNERCLFWTKTFEALSNIRVQVDLTPWVGILWPVTPHHVARVISGHERSPTIFRQ